MKFTDELLKRIMGKCVRITCADMKSYVGRIDDYIHAEDNYNDKAGLIMETEDKRLIEFGEDESVKIELYDPAVEENMATIKKIRFKMWENGICTVDDMETLVCEIFPDGKVSRYIYQGRDRKSIDKMILHIPENEMHSFLMDLVEALTMNEKDIVVCEVCDGSSYTLQITYMDGHKKVINGDVGGGTYDMLLTEFIDSVFE